jgi:signal transduction histidine kinase
MFLGVVFKTDLADGLPQVMGDVSRLEEVFLNLFINAADAMESKGMLHISSRLSSTGMVKISITDTGKGIDKAYLPHIFEPFFTTKEPGQGTGLGLSITYGIIQKHNGFIDVESEPGKGTTFIITLPPCSPAPIGCTESSQEENTIG